MTSIDMKTVCFLIDAQSQFHDCFICRTKVDGYQNAMKFETNTTFPILSSVAASKYGYQNSGMEY